jgi:hypothetical protein
MNTVLRTLQLFSGGLLVLGLSSCCYTKAGGGRTVALFNGKDLTGWQYVSADPQVPMEKVWSVRDGMLVCQGTPVGALFKGPEVTNFRLVVEYRWAAAEKPGNSGIFSRIKGEMKAIPPAIEVQLQHGNAGDVMGLHGKNIAPGQPRFFAVKAHPLAGDIAGVKKLVDAEKPSREWNHVEIVAEGPHYTVRINGQLVNEVDGVEVVRGPVGVQSEGGAVEFRRIALTPLD